MTTMDKCSITDDANIRIELENVEKELRSIENQLDDLLEKQSNLQQKRNSLRKQLKLASEQRMTAHNWSSESFNWSSSLKERAKSVFGVTDFRPLQLETMNTTLSKIDCIVIMPTGAGKSLCYQLTSLLESGLTVVISPLVSLMEDQLMALEHFGVPSGILNANSSKDTVNRVHNNMVTTPCPLRLLYVTPEKLAKSKRFMNKLEQCYKRGLLNRIAIDEVHCCSQWGHDFRPDYKFLGILKRQFPETPLLGLTATASSQVLSDVQKILHIQNAMVYRGSFNRENLNYSVELKPSSHDSCMDYISKLIKSKYALQSGIIYCFSRKDTVTVSDGLNKRGVLSACYHADLPAETRNKVHSLWSKNKIQVIVATIAFGMGIDKPDVRFVIHHSISKSVENYYQESGRAGRDGKHSDCVLFYRLGDVFRQSCMVFTESTGLEKLYNMLQYCLDNKSCRRRLLASHFSESWSDKSCHKMCDHCKNGCYQPLESLSITDISQSIDIVYAVIDKASNRDIRLTALKVIEAMLGKGPTQTRVDGVSSLSRDQCEYLIGCMLAERCLKEDFHFTPYSTISYVVIGSRSRSLNCLPDSQESAATTDKASYKRKADVTTRDNKVRKKVSASSSNIDEVIVLD